MTRTIAVAALIALAGCSSKNQASDQAPAQPDPHTLADGTIGSSCGTCRPELVCASGQSIPEGYCTRRCSASADCGAGNVCYHVGQDMLCLKGCVADGDCRASYACQGDPGATVCFPTGGAPAGGNDQNDVSGQGDGGAQPDAATTDDAATTNDAATTTGDAATTSDAATTTGDAAAD